MYDHISGGNSVRLLRAFKTDLTLGTPKYAVWCLGMNDSHDDNAPWWWSRDAVFEGMLELSKHFEDGAKKYGEYNWQKGIPVRRYVDSAIRHYLKHMAGWKDEPHDRAFIWNLVCCLWTLTNKPELNDL